MKDGFISNPLSTESFFSRNKKYLLAGTAVVAGAILGPIAIGGVVTALAEAGIAAGSIAAWMMSLEGGAVAAVSLVAILQSVGAAGLGIGAVIAFGSGGGIVGILIAKTMLKVLESNPERLAELENFVSIDKRFDLAREIAKDRAKKFEFLVIRDDERCHEGIEILHQHLIKINGSNCVTTEQRNYVLNLNNL
ncbi:12614_t:CDS:2 [Funneliformis mosseae]|uniref:12614_t:CDS:1 n=1 Tax=Funneliformis mosseae TaxID=27381 RepID=A0A9N8VG13_FUNMO|nr:12614_t:CDS:2 [Funneliformis mosseae]